LKSHTYGQQCVVHFSTMVI